MADNVVLPRNVEGVFACPRHSHTVAFSHYNNLSAQLPLDENGVLVEGGIAEQAEQCFKNIKNIVEGIDHVMNDVIRVTIFVKDILEMDAVDAVYKKFFPTYVPARTVVAVDDLPHNAEIQVEALISNAEGTIPNAPQAGDILKYTNNTHNAPSDVLSTQTVAFSHYNNITCQLPLDPATNQVVSTCVHAQTRQCLRNIKNILNSIDVPFDDIVKINIFVTDLKDVEAIDTVYTTFFPDSGIARAVGYFPARTIVPVKALPMHARVAIEAVCSHGDGTPPQAVEDRHGLIIEANNKAAAPVSKIASQTVAFSHYNNITGQLPVDAEGNKVAGGVAEQARQCLTNIKNIIESVDHVMEDAVKVNVFLTSLEDIAAFNEVYAEFFPTGAPARRVVGVSELPLGANVMVDAIFGNAEGTPPLA